MRCFICNSVIEEPVYNTDYKAYDPCRTCTAVINDLIAGYGDRPAVSEDEFLDPLIVEGLYPTEYDPFETGDEA